jgi:hypothetical protein
MNTILSVRPAPSKHAPEPAKCPHCDFGRCEPGTRCCKICLDTHRRSQEARERAQRRELLARFAKAATCRPLAYLEFHVDIAHQAQGGST